MTDAQLVGHGRSPNELAETAGALPPTLEQSAVISAGLGPALITAGAGSGKTHTLSMRIAFIVDNARQLCGHDISPEEILCLTFTRKAAGEIRDRASRVLKAVFPGTEAIEPTVATYNGYAAGLMAEHGLRLGYDPEAGVLTAAGLWQLAVEVVEGWDDSLDVDVELSTLTKALPILNSQMSDNAVSPERLAEYAGALASHIEGLSTPSGRRIQDQIKQSARMRSRASLATLVEAFRAAKADRAVIDYSDQISAAIELARIPHVARAEQAKYRVVLLDEFQDTSVGQLALFQGLFRDRPHIEAVGDPYQAIYGFRGASENSLARFLEAFGGSEVVRQGHLSVSWRNEPAVLKASEAITSSLRPRMEEASLDVPTLRSRHEELSTPSEQLPPSQVRASFFPDDVTEADALVAWIVDSRAELESHRDQVATSAVLCRTRAQFPAVIDALRQAGVAYEVTGVGGLLHVPEVVETLALLEVAHDPGRGDSLMRLLTSERWAIGPRDIVALSDWAEELAGPRESREKDVSLADALHELPDSAWVSPRGRSLTDTARERLAVLAQVVEDVQRHTFLEVDALVVHAFRALGLDIEVAVRDGLRAPNALDALVDVAREYARNAERATIGGLLAYCDAAREHEAGLEGTEQPQHPGAVTVQTIHAAKGLEWDVVAIPGLTSEAFPSPQKSAVSTGSESAPGWLKERAELPWALRMDADVLPLFEWESSTTWKEYQACEKDFKLRAGAHAIQEDRRLMYVAITRARSHVWMSGAQWSRNATTSRQPSIFMNEILAQVGEGSPPAQRGEWVDGGEPGQKREVSAPEAVPWPRVGRQHHRALFAKQVRQAPKGASLAEVNHPLAPHVAALLEEHRSRAHAASVVEMPSHLSSTALVSLARDSGK